MQSQCLVKNVPDRFRLHNISREQEGGSQAFLSRRSASTGKRAAFSGKKRCDIEFVRPRRRCALAGLSSTRGRSQRPFVEKLASVAPIGSLSRSKQRGNGPLLSHGDLLGRVALPRRFVDTSKKPDGFINPAGDEAARVKICKKWSELTSLLLGGERSIMEYVSRNGCE